MRSRIVRRAIGVTVAGSTLALGGGLLLPSVASAQPKQSGLVNVDVSHNNVAVGVGANVCDVYVLSSNNQAATCTTPLTSTQH